MTSEDEPEPDSAWQRLSGGTVSTVERRGMRVRRATGSWTPAVHAVLRHLETVGFSRAPRVLGVDEARRELLSFLPGQVPSSPWRWTGDDEALVAAGRLLREYHDAVATFPLHRFQGWDPLFQERPGPHGEVVCHNDFGVYNCVFVGGLPWGMIDFDCAAPGSRVWDLAWTAVGFVPFNPGMRVPDRPRRLRLLCDAYGLDDRSHVVDVMRQRLERARDGLRALAGTDARQAAAPSAHVTYCERALLLIAAQRAALETALR